MPRKLSPNALVGVVVGGVALMLFLVAVVVVIALNAGTGSSGGGGGGNLFSPAVVDIGNGAELENDFLQNVIAAEQKWIGKRVRMFGTVVTINRNEGQFYLAMWGYTFVYPASGQLDKFARVKVNDLIEVEATVGQYDTASTGPARGLKIHLHDAKFLRFRDDLKK